MSWRIASLFAASSGDIEAGKFILETSFLLWTIAMGEATSDSGLFAAPSGFESQRLLAHSRWARSRAFCVSMAARAACHSASPHLRNS